MKFSVDVSGWLGTKCRRNIAENLNRLSRVHECYRRQTDDRRQTYDRQTADGRATAYSEREREFTFAKNCFLGVPFLRTIFAMLFHVENSGDVDTKQ